MYNIRRAGMIYHVQKNFFLAHFEITLRLAESRSVLTPPFSNLLKKYVQRMSLLVFCHLCDVFNKLNPKVKTEFQILI